MKCGSRLPSINSKCAKKENQVLLMTWLHICCIEVAYSPVRIIFYLILKTTISKRI